MMLEGPLLHGVLGRLPEPALHLAASNIALALSLVIESPVIMLLATSIALVKDGGTFLALRRFTVSLCFWLTVLTALLAFTPLYDVVVFSLLDAPRPIGDSARPALQIMLLWTAAIGWRRFYQGVLVKMGRSSLVSWGTAIRLGSAAITALLLIRFAPHLTGSEVFGIVLMAAVISEALVTTLFARPLVRTHFAGKVEGQPLSQRAILKFHLPLAGTTLLTLLAQPMTAAALSRLDDPKMTLAAWPVIFSTLLVIRGWCFAVQEITVALYETSSGRLRQFSWLVGLGATGVLALLAFTPILPAYLEHVLKVAPELRPLVVQGCEICIALPLITSLGSWARGALVATQRTPKVYTGMAINIGSNGAMLVAGVLFGLPGILVGTVSFVAAATIELVYLGKQAAKIADKPDR